MILAHANHLVDQGYLVTIMTSYVDTVFPINSKVKVEPIGYKSKFGTLWHCIRHRLQGDVFIADIIPLAFLLFFRHRKRVIYFAQDYNESCYVRVWQKKIIRCLYFMGLSMFRIPVIAVSEHLAEIFRQRFNSDITVATNGIDNSVFYPDPEPKLQAIKRDRKAILVFSRKDERKGFDIAINVLGKLFESSHQSFVVWSVGIPTRFMPGIEYHDFGYVGETELRRIMSSADIFFYPSRHEGFGLMPLEALACGCPLVTTEALKIVSHNVNALVSPLDDIESMQEHITLLLSDSKLASRLVVEGKKLVQVYSLEKSRRIFASALVAKGGQVPERF